jgi:hypothetical protein
MRNAFILFGKSIHASMPKAGGVMKERVAPAKELFDKAIKQFCVDNRK